MSDTDPHHGSLNESNIVKLVSDEWAKFELNSIIILVQKDPDILIINFIYFRTSKASDLPAACGLEITETEILLGLYGKETNACK